MIVCAAQVIRSRGCAAGRGSHAAGYSMVCSCASAARRCAAVSGGASVLPGRNMFSSAYLTYPPDPMGMFSNADAAREEGTERSSSGSADNASTIAASDRISISESCAYGRRSLNGAGFAMSRSTSLVRSRSSRATVAHVSATCRDAARMADSPGPGCGSQNRSKTSYSWWNLACRSSADVLPSRGARASTIDSCPRCTWPPAPWSACSSSQSNASSNRVPSSSKPALCARCCTTAGHPRLTSPCLSLNTSKIVNATSGGVSCGNRASDG